MHRNGDPVNILLVDDQPAKLLSYEVILEELGENLIKATSGRQALEQLLRQDVAVILVDVSMPELDGFELAAMIREHPRFQRTAIIFVSAVYLSEIDSLRGYRAGAVDYLPVPIVPELLRAKVRVFCDLFRKTRQLEALNAELEQRVADRTAELAAANADLEMKVEARTREREEALAQVAEMQKLESLGQLTGGLAHDFNNLLMVVMSSLELARKHAKGDDRLTGWLSRAMEAAGRGAALTKRMLAFARRQDLKPETVVLSDVVNGMVGDDVALTGSDGADCRRPAERSSRHSDRPQSVRTRAAQSRTERARRHAIWRGSVYNSEGYRPVGYFGQVGAGLLRAIVGDGYRRGNGRRKR